MTVDRLQYLFDACDEALAASRYALAVDTPAEAATELVTKLAALADAVDRVRGVRPPRRGDPGEYHPA